MTYYIVFNEWNYPTESGREFVGDFDSREEADWASAFEVVEEEPNFLKVNKTSYDVTIVDDKGYCAGHILSPTEDRFSEYFFRSVIIERKV